MKPRRQAFTLLEIVLALALLAGAIAALGEVLRLSRESAAGASEETQAQLLAASVMGQLMSGVIEPLAIEDQLFDVDADPLWQYSVAIMPTEYDELVLLQVLVNQKLPEGQQGTSFQLDRWVLDPEYVEQLNAAAATAASQASTTSGGTQ
jgi:type II secretory pathway pseudopilin PulG